MVQQLWSALIVLGGQAFAPAKRDERGVNSVEWMILLVLVIGMAYFAGNAGLDYLKSLVGKLGA